MSEPLTDVEIRELREEWSDGWRGGQGTTAPLITRDQVLRLLDEVERLRARVNVLEDAAADAIPYMYDGLAAHEQSKARESLRDVLNSD